MSVRVYPKLNFNQVAACTLVKQYGGRTEFLLKRDRNMVTILRPVFVRIKIFVFSIRANTQKQTEDFYSSEERSICPLTFKHKSEVRKFKNNTFKVF